MAIPEIGVDELAAKLAEGAIHLIDVREPDEFAAGHVPGAILIPLGSVPQRVDEFRGGDPTYVICRSGGRSLKACEVVADQGVQVVNVAGGTLAWIDSGRTVETGGS